MVQPLETPCRDLVVVWWPERKDDAERRHKAADGTVMQAASSHLEDDHGAGEMRGLRVETFPSSGPETGGSLD